MFFEPFSRACARNLPGVTAEGLRGLRIWLIFGSTEPFAEAAGVVIASFGFPEKKGCVGLEGLNFGALGLGGGAIGAGLEILKLSEPSIILAIWCPRA